VNNQCKSNKQQDKDFRSKNVDLMKKNEINKVVTKEEKRLMGSAAGRP
jgi:hypothetical protein